MSWREVRFYEWACDVCGLERRVYDDLTPEGWTHDQLGRDRCADCSA